MGLDSKTQTGRFLKGTEIYFKWMVLVWFVALGGIRIHRRKVDPRRLKRVLFVRHDKLGDMIISLPIFHCFRKHFPNVEIDILCGKDNNMIIEHDPNISNIMYYRKKPLEDIRQIKFMRSRKYDAIVDMTFGESVTATILLSLIGPGALKLGAGKSRLKQFFDQTVAEEDVRGPHIIDTTASILQLFDLETGSCDMIPQMYLVEEDEAKAKEFLAKLRVEHETIIVINLSAGRPARTWPVERYIEFLRKFIPRYPDAGIVLSAPPNDRWKIDRLREAVDGSMYAIPTGYSSREIAGLLKNVDFLLTPDTSIGHIASCVNLPALAMYPGNIENFAVWEPFNPCVRAINSPDFYRIEYLEVNPVLDKFCDLIETETRGRVKSDA